jgi:hypothetical protein
MRALWRRLVILITGYDAERQRREFDAVKAAFDALPRPKDMP